MVIAAFLTMFVIIFVKNLNIYINDDSDDFGVSPIELEEIDSPQQEHGVSERRQFLQSNV